MIGTLEYPLCTQIRAQTSKRFINIGKRAVSNQAIRRKNITKKRIKLAERLLDISEYTRIS